MVKPITSISDKDNCVRFLYGQLSLLNQLLFYVVLSCWLKSTCIAEIKRITGELSAGKNPIARNAWLIVNQTFSLFYDFIKQRTFSNVRAANDGNESCVRSNWHGIFTGSEMREFTCRQEQPEQWAVQQSISLLCLAPPLQVDRSKQQSVRLSRKLCGETGTAQVSRLLLEWNIGAE